MKRLWTFVVAGLLVVALTAPAPAWEFDMKGTMYWNYDYTTQAGGAGFFGQYDQTTPGLGGLGAADPNWAGFNGWVGARTISGVQLGTVTGKDASYNYMRMELFPEIRINPAIQIRGAYQIGGNFNAPGAANAPVLGTGALVAGNISSTGFFDGVRLIPGVPNALGTAFGWYQNSASYGAWNPIDTGSWTQLWATAQTPWGIIVIGKRPFAFGTGSQYDGNQASSESFAIVAPYGPFRIGFAWYPHRRQTFINAYPAIVPAAGGRNAISFFDGGQAIKPWDHDSERHGQPGVFFTYRQGNVDIGAVYEWMKLHAGPQHAPTRGGATNGAVFSVTRDETLEDGGAYIMYNNGRFFFNFEMDWLRGQVNYQRPLIATVPVDPGDGGGSPYAPQGTELWKLFLETGAMCGPAKVSFLYSWVPGPDRRHGIWINNQTWENVVNGSFLGNATPFLPYSYLLSYTYGAGLNALNRNGEGYMTDASSYGVRFDYAVAANLNWYASGFYATRVSKGWPWGILTLDANGNVVLLGRSNLAGFINTAPQNVFAAGASAPNIPDDGLGWEVTSGIDWKLLEGLTFKFRAAYWQPGKWFSFACIDRNIAADDGAGPVNATGAAPVILPAIGDGAAIGSAWGVNPNKEIDGIWGFTGQLLVEF